jgi:hypothetical protein
VVRKTIAVISLVLVLIAWRAAATPLRLKVSVFPSVSFEPSDLMIRVIVERHADNRVLDVLTESEEFSCSSDRQLDGEDSPRVMTFQCRGAPAGEYDIHAALIGPDGKARAEALGHARVVGRGLGH